MQKSSLRISLQNLPSFDIFSKSDPFIVVLEKEIGLNKWIKIGSTEYVKNDNNPIFVRTIPVEYINTNKLLRFGIYDRDSKSSKLDRHDYFGSVDLKLDQILRGCSVERIKLNSSYGDRYLTNSKGKSSTITVEVEPFRTNNANYTFKINGKKLAKKDFFSSDPYFLISKKIKNKECIVYRSETIKKNLNPRWDSFALPSLDICDNKTDTELTFWCYDYDKASSNDLIGKFRFTLNEIINGKKKFELKHPRKKTPQGTIKFEEVIKKNVYNFEDFCKAGLDFTTIVSVDFSASSSISSSNGDVHAYNGECFNSMQLCLTSLSQIDSDQEFPVWGFGAILGGKMNNCFSMTFNPQVPKVYTVQNVMGVYQHALTQVGRGVSKDISEVLMTFLNIVRKETLTSKSKYYVLFVFTHDGKIAFLEKTKNIVVDLSELPVSILFIGVGSGKFSDFSFLDEDWWKFKTSYGKSCKRDCVSLLRFRSFVSANKNANQISAELNAMIYRTIKTQSLKYFKLNKLNPKMISDSVNMQKQGFSTPCGGQNFNPQPYVPQKYAPQQGGNYLQSNMHQPNTMQPQSFGQHPNNNFNNQGQYPNNRHQMNPQNFPNNLQNQGQGQYGGNIPKQQYGNYPQSQNQFQPQSIDYNQQVKQQKPISSNQPLNQHINNNNERNFEGYSSPVPLKDINQKGGNDIQKIENQMSSVNLSNETNKNSKKVQETNQPPINPNYFENK